MLTRTAKQAFTLVELLVVMAIIAILISITLGVAGRVSNDGAESRAKGEMAQIQLEIELFKADRGSLPADGSTLGEDFFLWFEEKYGDGNGVFDADDRIYDTVDMSVFRNPDGTMTPSSMRLRDPWGRDYRYDLVNPFLYFLSSDGPDMQQGTPDDISTRKGSNL